MSIGYILSMKGGQPIHHSIQKESRRTAATVRRHAALRKTQTPARNYYPLPKVLCRLGLSPGEIAVYSFLMYCENRTTYQCYPSYRTIGEAVGMSRNTVAKYVRQLEEKGLIRTEHTTVTLKDGRKRNGSLLYTILPPEQAVEQFNQQQLAKAEAVAERRRIQDKLAKQAAEAPPSPL